MEVANKLKNLVVTKVDFVDEGANQRADIKLMKSKNDKEVITDPDISLFKKFKNWFSRQPAEERIEKTATSFEEQLNSVSMEQIRDEIWSVCYALQNSFNSILCDAELGENEKRTAMETSADQFNKAIKDYAEKWCNGITASIRKRIEKPDDIDMLMINKAYVNLEEIINKSREEGENEDMLRIDKSKMTPEERATYDDIIKKYAVESEEAVEKKVNPEENEDSIEETEKKESCKKSLAAMTQDITGASVSAIPDDGDVYKGIHPAVKAQLEELLKFRNDAEDKELREVAKKYECIGKNTDQLVPVLKNLKAAGGTAYADMISMLDACVEVQNNSAMFSEIGKSGSYKGYAGTIGIAKSASESQISQIAKSYVEKEPSMSMADAVAKAWVDHPELMAEYEAEAGF